ncbi:MAG: GGDEF domain-containing protein [Butyrivibrio sp.]|nr:GGDEF domain-containing protein [Butyrivibrio sp.]
MLEQYFINTLEKAIDEKWIRAYHQPLIRAASGFVSDEEAFARWEDPYGDIFKASEFIPILDRAGLTYRVDLYMFERILEKMKDQEKNGLFIVPESINLSRSDFYSCDMVSEVIKRIDESGIPREKLAVELSENTISTDIDFFKKQAERFQSEGIKVWMDNYGSGYASFLILLKMRFDLLKIDKIIIDQIELGHAGQIILTELIRTSVALGMDTVASGVETKNQADFLMEVGCTKLQGNYYLKPVSLSTIIRRNKLGIQIGFENPAEAEYYDQLGKVNLYEFSVTKDVDQSLNHYFDTMPMAIFSISNDKVTFIRGNKSYRAFIKASFPDPTKIDNLWLNSAVPGTGHYSFNAVIQCASDGKRKIIDDRMHDGRNIQIMIQRIAINPVTNSRAVQVVILSLSDKTNSENLTYNYIARALTQDYVTLFFVDLDTGKYTQYSSDGANRDIKIDMQGDNFFNFDENDYFSFVLPEDIEHLRSSFTRDNIEKNLASNGKYSSFARLSIDGKTIFINIKVVKVSGSDNFIIIGINNVDEEVKAREALKKAEEERIIYSRIGALSDDYIYLYTVNPSNNHYKKFCPNNIKTDMGIPYEGNDFFDEILRKAHLGIHPDDLDGFLLSFNKENVIHQIENKGLFENYHRLIIKNEPRYVVMRANIVCENGEDKLIFGVFDIDEKVKREQEFEKSLYIAQSKANLDELTGVKNKHAYANFERKMNELIMHGSLTAFAIAVFDINGLKQINDTLGHQAGDEFIKHGCDTICRFFKHSPVFRIGGDEFVVIVRGYDYLNVDVIMSKFNKHNIKNMLKNDVVIAAGMSKYNDDGSVAPVFKRADEEMYDNKRQLKKPPLSVQTPQ